MSPSYLHLPFRSIGCGFALVAGTLSFASSASAAAPASCPSLDVVATPETIDAIRASILCLTNAERSQRGLVSLRENPKLRKAALSHSSDMVREGYFSHTAPDGDTFVDRIVNAGYVRRGDGSGWSLGENLAWGTGEIGTPRGVHTAWMGSSGHRSNILKSNYREIGIGVRLGVPKNAAVGATYTTEFGTKS